MALDRATKALGQFGGLAQARLVLGLLLVFGDFFVDHFAHPGLQAKLLRLQLSAD